MSLRSKTASKKSPAKKSLQETVDALEPRQYLTGLVYNAPVVSTTASLGGITPVFANLYPFVTVPAGQDDPADLFVANTSDSVSVMLSNGNGTFAAPDTIPVAGTPLPLAVGDFNGDGNADIVAGTSGNPTGDISIILGNGNGTFQAAENIPALANNQAIAVGAFINGGPQDIITVSNSASDVNNAAIIFLNSNGTEKSFNPFSLPFGSVSAVAAGDFTGNGNIDFAVVGQQTNEVAVYLGNGDGTFQQETTYTTGAGTSPTSIAVGNFRDKTINGRPELDIVTADSTGGGVSFLANNGNGTFASPVITPITQVGTGGGPLKVRLANLNNNSQDIPGLICLLSPGSSAQAVALLGNGNGTFFTGATIDIPGSSTFNAIAAGDLVGSPTAPLTDLVLTNGTQVASLVNDTAGDARYTPTAAVTPTATNPTPTTIQFTVTYTDQEQVDASSLGNTNLTVTFPDGMTTQVPTLVPMSYADQSSLVATYELTFPSALTPANDGTYTVAMNAVGPSTSPVTNADNIAVVPGTIGSFSVTVQAAPVTPPPTAAIVNTQIAGSTSSNLIQFTVTYTASTTNSPSNEIVASTIGNNNLVVTFPTGLTVGTANATLASSSLVNGLTVQALYDVTFPSNLTMADNGTYGVSINANSVMDLAGHSVAAGSIGSLSLTVSSSAPPAGPTGDFTVGSPIGKILSSVVGGSKQNNLAVHVTNNGTVTTPITGTVTVTLYYSDTTIHDSSAVAVAITTQKVKKLKVGKGFIAHFKKFNYPSTAGTYYLVADAALNGTLNSTDGASSAITVAPAFVHGVAQTVTTTKPDLIAGTKYTATLLLENVGNVAYNGPATVGVAVQPTGGSATSIVAAPVPIRVQLKPSQSKKFKVTFIPTNLPISGSDYSLVLTINIPGDSSATSASSTTLLTI